MYNRIKSKFCHFTICGLAVLCCTFLSSSASAVDMSPNVHPIWTNANPTCAFYTITPSDTNYYWVNNTVSNNFPNTTLSFPKINCDYPSGLQTLNTYAVYSFRFDNYAYDNSADSGWLASKVQSVSGSANWGVIGQNVSAMGSTGYQIDIYLYGQASTTGGGTFQIYNPLNSSELFYLKPNERVTFVGASYWAVSSESDFEYDYTTVLGNLFTQVDKIRDYMSGVRYFSEISNEKLYYIRQTVNGISDKIDDLKSLQQQANQDAQDRYDAEKQEESQREESISGSSDDAQSLFSFSVLNPFSGIFNLFKNDCSANIPIIASWLHAPSNTYTSWWCPIESQYGIRSYLTPVFGIASMMLLFGFVIRWLSNNSGDIYGARNFNKEING